MPKISPTEAKRIMRKRLRDNDARQASLNETNKKVKALQEDLENLTMNGLTLNKLVSNLTVNDSVKFHEIESLVGKFENSLR